MFFFLCGGKEIIHCFRNIFRNPSATTTAPASATCISHITLPRASATLFSWFLLPRTQRHYVFQGFWLWLVSFPFILAFWAFVSAVFYQHPLPQPSAKDTLPRSFRGLNPVHFLKNKKLRKLLHKNGKKNETHMFTDSLDNVSDYVSKLSTFEAPSAGLKTSTTGEPGAPLAAIFRQQPWDAIQKHGVS